MRRFVWFALALTSLYVLATACDEPFPFSEERFGALRIALTTTGGDIDLDGYTLTVDAGTARPIEINGTLVLSDLPTGEHSVELRGWAENCVPNGSTLRAPLVQGRDTVVVSFVVNCAASGVQVTISTEGLDRDLDGYTLRVDGGQPVLAPANGFATITRLALGSHVVELGENASNCIAAEGNAQTISLATYQVVPLNFTVRCGALTGSLMVTTVTSGALLDPDGFMVTIDAGPQTPIGLNASVTRQSLNAGLHTATLAGVAGNCSVAESNPATAQVRTGGLVRDTARVVFHVNCVSDLGAVRVTTATTGVDPDLSGYYLTLDGDDYYPAFIGSNGVLTFDNLPEGVHTVLLTGVAANCRVSGENPQSPTVVRSTVQDIRFDVACVERGRLEITVTTSGVDLDADGYVISIGNATRTLPANGTVTITGLDPGEYPLGVSGLTVNCDVTALNPPTVTVPVGAAVTATLSVTCATAAQLAFVLGNDIYAAKSNATGLTRLTVTTATETFPSWSPDGSRLAFTSDRDGPLEIFVMTADGQSLLRLSPISSPNFSPTWSPDGTRIAFVSMRDGNAEIYVMNADGSGATRLTNNPAEDSDPAWSPDGTTIAFHSTRDGPGGIYAMSESGANVTPLYTQDVELGAREPAWSPDGARIAFSRMACDYYYGCERDIYVMNANGTGATPIVTGPADQGSPAWSRDGRWVAFSTMVCYYYYGCNDAALAAVRGDGTDYRLVLPNAQVSQPAWRP